MHRRLAVVVAALALVVGAAPAAHAATHWAAGLRTGSHGQAKGDAAPATPTGVTAVCQSTLLNGNIVVSWSAVTHASAYQVYDSTSLSGTYAKIGPTVSTTSETVAPGIVGSFYFKVQALAGANWTGAQSAAAGPRTITALLLCQ